MQDSLTVTDKEHIFTVFELSQQIKTLLEHAWDSVWIKGELSNVKRAMSGHVYGVIKDENAQIDFVCFKSRFERLGIQLDEGRTVHIFGKVTVYTKGGRYQINALDIRTGGLGLQQMAFEQLKRALAEEGLFAAEHKKPLPMLPERIAVVTSPFGAAVKDIIQVLERRFATIHIIIYPVTVQGDAAEPQIRKALERLNELNAADVLIIARGGGSAQDLMPFNTEGVVRAVHASRIPVISAVGHEIDWTLCDLAADLRVPTPSAAAELVVESKEKLREKIVNARRRMGYTFTSRFNHCAGRLKLAVKSRYMLDPLEMVRDASFRLDTAAREFDEVFAAILYRYRERFIHAVTSFNILNPFKVIDRGYSIMTDEQGTIITTVSAVSPGMTVKNIVSDGTVTSHVRKITDKKVKLD